MHYIYVSDVCNNLTITSARLQRYYGLGTKGTGTANADGTITITWSVAKYFENNVMTLKRKE